MDGLADAVLLRADSVPCAAVDFRLAEARVSTEMTRNSSQPSVRGVTPISTQSKHSACSGSRAHVFVSWLHPFKKQKLVIIVSEAMAVPHLSRRCSTASGTFLNDEGCSQQRASATLAEACVGRPRVIQHGTSL